MTPVGNVGTHIGIPRNLALGDYGMAGPTSLRRHDAVLNDAVDRLEAMLDQYEHGELLLDDLWVVLGAAIRELERGE